ncbi:MAG: response regulator transcription factor [Desulfuromonadales bacterium]|nr:response regulator transcription factor [Desulfuromonadales bacterium]
MSIKVLLVDDHKIMREGLKALLSKATDIEVVAQAANGVEAIQKTADYCPDVIVMDLTMPKMGGIEATRRIVATNPDIKTLALSMVMDRSCVVECLKAGAKGYLIKDCAGDELIGAIRTLASGDSYLCSRITELVISDYAQHATNDTSSVNAKLSRREQEVLQLIADGKNTKEIAFTLAVSTKTVEVQRSSIMKKLDLHSIAELTKYALREGLTSIEPWTAISP